MRTSISCAAGAALLLWTAAAFSVSPTPTRERDAVDTRLAVTPCMLSCPLPCPTGGLAENEPTCHDDYVDAYNGGCGSNPTAFTTLPCTDPGRTLTVCGTYGGFTFEGLDYRDTDWYQIVLVRTSTITWCVTGEDDTLCGILDGRAGCPATGFYDYALGDCCTPHCVAADLPAGTWWLWVGTLEFGSGADPCGSRYIATLTGHDGGPIAVEPATWGRSKGVYR
jgi:hypothetical protein